MKTRQRATTGSRMVERRGKVTGPRPPKVRSVVPRQIGDYPGVPQAILALVEKLSSPFMLGPPVCDELVALVAHLFTEEEAGVVLPLTLYRARTAAEVAAAVRRPAIEVEALLDRLAIEKRVILSEGPAGARRYRALPVVPGIFELCLCRVSEDTLTPWHRRFAELIDALYETGYLADYIRPGGPRVVRTIPVNVALHAYPSALPVDRMDEYLDRFDDFAVGLCQCRMSEELVGRGCGRPKMNCTAVGGAAGTAVSLGIMKRVSRAAVLEIKREAEAHGLVNWVMNVEAPHGFHCSCSCCGCCCKNFRAVSEFNAPGAIAPPRYTPSFDRARCTWCAKCALGCPMAAITVDAGAKSIEWRAERCIGCGLCAAACAREKAVSMEPVKNPGRPYGNFLDAALRAAPRALGITADVWIRRRLGAPRGR